MGRCGHSAVRFSGLPVWLPFKIGTMARRAVLRIKRLPGFDLAGRHARRKQGRPSEKIKSQEQEQGLWHMPTGKKDKTVQVLP